MFSSSQSSLNRYRLRCSFCTREMDSTPAPTATSIPSTMICLAAMATAIRPDAHWRSTVVPGTVTGSPERSAA